jgi:demethylmenaquinone methyltransferase/2-methoxy-6-polyprenyl-1,4-benzoquinol methylase
MKKNPPYSLPRIARSASAHTGRSLAEPASTETRDRFVKQIFTTVAPYVDALSRGFSLGLDRFWRTRAVALSGIKRGDRVLDICSGTGELAFILARAVGSEGSVTGADFCAHMLEIAKEKAGLSHPNLAFVLADAKDLPFPDNSFDAVTVSFGMRNIPDTTLAMKEIRRVLRPGGVFLCLELTKPRSRWFQALYEWYVFRLMPFVANFVIKSRAPYLYLPRSIEAFYQPPEFREVIAKNGFSGVAVHSLTLGIATVYRAVRNATPG